jgi:hypothetical protein
MHPIKTPWLMFWHTFGFSGVGDFISTAFGMKSSASVFVQVATAAGFSYFAILEKYIYSPGQAVVLMIAMILADTILGAMVAVKKGEKFNMAKISRFLPIVCAHVMIMSATWHFKQIDLDAYGWMPTATFGFLGVRNLLSVIRNMIKLKYIRADFLSFLNTKIDSDLLTGEDEPEKKDANVLPLILLLLSFSSCVSYSRCVKKYGVGSDTVYVSVHDTTRILLAGDSITRRFTDGTLDSMAIGDSFEFENPHGTEVTKADPNTTTLVPAVKVRIRKIGKGSYQAEGTVKPKEVIKYKTIQAKCPPCPKLEPPTSLKKKWFWLGILVGFVAGGLLTAIIAKLLK